MEVKLKDEDKALLFLNALPKKYKHFEDILLFRKEETITLDEVQTLIRTKELHKFQEFKESDNGSLNVTKSNGKKENEAKEKKMKQYSFDDLTNVECYNYHKKDHFKSNCAQ